MSLQISDPGSRFSKAAVDRIYWQTEAETEHRRRLEGEREEARKRFERLRNFCQQSWHVLRPGTPLKWGWCGDVICEHLEAVSKKQIKRLLINIAPRHTKSVITSINWPAWDWLHSPSTQFLFASHGDGLAIDLSVDCRRLLESAWYRNECLPDFVLTSDQNTKSHFDNSYQGSRIGLSITAGASGEGGDPVVIDDPHDRQDANSKAAIQAAINGYKWNISECLNDKIDGRVVVICHRVCTGDLTDLLLEEGGWEHVVLPTEFDNVKRSTSLGYYDQRTEEKELLHPDLFDALANEKAKLKGVQIYSAMHNQLPTPPGGVLFDIEKLEYVEQEAIDDLIRQGRLRRHRHWDLAATAEKPGKDPDYTVGLLMGIDEVDRKIYILDVKRFRKDPSGVETEIKETAKKDGIAVSITVEEEKASAGKHVANLYARHVLQGFNFTGQPIQGDKVARARPFAVQWNFGNVYAIKDAAWLFDYKYEMKDWPNTAHKDQGDGGSGAFNELMKENVSMGNQEGSYGESAIEYSPV